MKIVQRLLGFVIKNIYNSNMTKYKHKHTYVYSYFINKKAPFVGVTQYDYVLCTDHDNPNSKANRTILESMLRIVWGYMPKLVKFKYEKS
jgi:hypothetical protein